MELTVTGVGVATVVPTAGVVASTLSSGVSRDWQYGTTRNTAEATFGAAGAIGGGVKGGAEGSVKAAAACPSIYAPIAGAAVGATAGAMAGEMAGRELASKFFDHFDYDIYEYRCRKCKRRYKCRIYTSQSREYCPSCDDSCCPAPRAHYD